MPSWKKIIVSGSNAELNQLTATSYGGNISGSATSTGSFGKLQVGSATIQIPSNGFITMGSEEGMVKNTRFGNNAGQNLQAGGTQNVIVGEDAGSALTTGDKNVAMGVEALKTATGDSQNVAIGYRALKTLNTTNARNVAVGTQAGDGLTTGTANVLLGHSTDTSANDGTNQIAIGSDVIGLGDNQTVIGNSSQTHVVFGGDALISGSAASTGSFGKLLGDGSSLTGISATADVVDDTTPQLGGNLDLNSNNITGTGNIDILGTITAQNFIVSSSVTNIEYQSISGSTIFGDTEDDTHEFVGHVMMQSASFGMANHADRTNSNAANSYLFISQSVASKNGYVWQKAGNPGTNTFPFLLIDASNNQKASIRQDGRFSTPLVYLSNDNSGKLGEIDGDAGDSSAMYINANSRALQLSSEGKKTFKINTDGTTEIGGSGAYGVTNFGDLTVGGNLNLTASAATLEVAGNISGSATSTGSFGRTEGTSFSYVFDDEGSLVYDNDELVYRNAGAEKFKVDNSQLTTQVANVTQKIKLGGENKVAFDETSVSFVISQNDGGMQDNLTLTKEGNLTLHRGGLTLAGDLTVNGDTTTISTSNILVQDAFGFFATGSAGTNVDAGIIVQSGSFVDSGSALYHDISSERWSVGKGIASTATSVPDSKWGGFVATVYTASASPVGSSPKYGVGEIHVDDDGEIYIYS